MTALRSGVIAAAVLAFVVPAYRSFAAKVGVTVSGPRMQDSSVDFGSVPIGTEGFMPFRISNANPVTVDVDLSIFDPVFEISPPQVPVPPNGVATTGLFFRPTALGTLQDTLVIEVRFSGEEEVLGTFTRTVQGTGTGQPEQLRVAECDYDFNDELRESLEQSGEQPFYARLAANGGRLPYSWSFVHRGELPSTFELDPDGVLRGPASGIGGEIDFVVRVADADFRTDERTCTVRFTGADSDIQIITREIWPTARVGDNYSVTLEAIDGAPPYEWLMMRGARLPGGLDIRQGTIQSVGMVSGEPDRADTFTFGLTARDTNGDRANKVFRLTIEPASQGGGIQSGNVIPHIVAGEAGNGTWGTELQIFNLQDSPVDYVVRIFDSSGVEMSLNLRESDGRFVGNQSRLEDTLLARGSRFVQIEPPATLRQGYAVLESPASGVGINGVITLTDPGKSFRTSVPGLNASQRTVRFPYRESFGNFTGVAIRSARTEDIFFTARPSDGSPCTYTRRFAAREHTAFLFSQPTVVLPCAAGTDGVLDVTSGGEFTAIVLIFDEELRFYTSPPYELE